MPPIYGEQAAAVVVFVSAEYVTRDWTRLERRAALDRAVRERQEYVLPARFDDTPVPGLLAGMVAVDLRGRTPEQFADLVVEKLADLAISPSPPGGADRGPPGGVRVSAADPRRLGVHAAIRMITRMMMRGQAARCRRRGREGGYVGMSTSLLGCAAQGPRLLVPTLRRAAAPRER